MGKKNNLKVTTHYGDGSSSSSTDDSTEESKSCSQNLLKMLKRRLPITSWLPKYSKGDITGDLIAGVTVGLTVVPQSMAYAAIAGLTPEYGLYSSYIGVLIYVLLGSCKQATTGPTAVMSLLTFQTCGQDYPQCVVLTAFYSGVFELIMAFLQLGWVVSFISEPVTIGFASGAAMTIASSQVNSLLGLSGNKGNGFITYWQAIFKNIKTAQVGDGVLGIGSLILLLALRKLKDVNHESKSVKTAFWLISLARNVIVILVTSLIAFIWQTPPFKLVGNVNGGFPTVTLPQFELGHRPVYVNDTLVESSEYYSFTETWSILKTGPLIIALISILQNVAISKAFGTGQAVDATQEMLALGTSNVIGGFFSSLPISASFSRSAVNEASGVRSQMGGLYTGVLVLLSLNFLTSSFYWIPKASLSAVIIAAVIFMIDYESALPMWRISKIDAISCLVTFIASVVLGMEYGILIGVGVSIGALLLRNLHPELTSSIKTESITGEEYILVKPSNGLSFPSVDHITTSVQKLTLKHKDISVVILDFTKWTSCDYTGASTLVSVHKGMKKNGKILGFIRCSDVWVQSFKIAGLADPPVIDNEEEDLARFILELVQGKGGVKEKSRESLAGVIVTPSVPDVRSEVGVGSQESLKGVGEGAVEGVGGISMASTGSTADVTSLASSTRPII